MKPWLWGSIFSVLLFSACLKPELEELPFFTVETTFPILPDPSGIIGAIILEGEIQGLNQGDQIDDYGFLFSDDHAFVSDEANIEQSPYHYGSLTMQSSFHRFKEPDPVLVEEGKIYFVRAFAQKGDRLILGNIQQYDVNLGFEIEFTNRINDVLYFNSRISGLTDNINVSEFGILVADDSTNLNFNDAIQRPYGSLDSDRTINDTLFSLQFNTTYYFKPYAIGFDTTYGAIQEYRVKDGWKEVFSSESLYLPFKISNPVVVSNRSEAYLIGGCRAGGINDLCYHTDMNMDINTTIYKFTPSDDFGNGDWEFHDNAPNLLSQAIGSFNNEEFFVGFGQVGTNAINYLVDPLNNQIVSSCSEAYPSFYNMVSFTTIDAIYFGTGRNGSELTNFFWQLKLVDGCMEITSMPPMPFHDNGEDVIQNGGREGAITLQANGRYFVGFGNKGSLQLNDVYEFIPPAGNDPAKWNFVGLADGPGKRQEAMSFSIGERAFVGFGYNVFEPDGYLNDLWEFCPSDENMWEKREPLPGQGRRSGFSFTLNDLGYIGGGKYIEFGPMNTVRQLSDTWVYFPPTNE